MLPISLTFVFFLAIGLHGAPQDANLGRPTPAENNFALGQIRISKDGKTEELVPVTEGDITDTKPTKNEGSVQALPSPCSGLRPKTRLPHPSDKTKYIQCRDQFHYEVFLCPNHGEFDEMARTCVAVTPSANICEDEKPCLNNGECLMANSTFKCNCDKDWTGERCETPIHICATKPCGPNAECRPMKATDYKQDYICICNGKKEYGPDCSKTVQNPCALDSDQFFPFAFSPRLYIQCDGESLFVQPCGSSLYWNQEQKVCTREKPGNMEKKPTGRRFFVKTEPILTDFKPAVSVTSSESQSSSSESKSSSSFTKTVSIDENKFDSSKTQAESESSFSFVPTLVTAQTNAARDTVFAVDSQSANREVVNRPFISSFQTSGPSISISSQPSQIRFNQVETIRTETLPVQVQVRPTITQTVHTQTHQQRIPFTSTIQRFEIPTVQQTVSSVGVGETQKINTGFQNFQQVDSQGSVISSNGLNSGFNTQGFQSGNPSRQEFRTGSSGFRVQTSPTFEHNDVQKTRIPLTQDSQKFTSLSSQQSQQFTNTNSQKSQQFVSTNGQQSQRFNVVNDQEPFQMSEMQNRKSSETQFVTGFAPSVRGDRDNLIRKEESSLNSNIRTFGTRAFPDNQMDSINQDVNRFGFLDTTTAFNRFQQVPSNTNEMNNNRMTNQQQTGFKNVETESNEVRGEEFPSTTFMTPTEMPSTQFRPNPSQNQVQLQRLPVAPSTTNNMGPVSGGNINRNQAVPAGGVPLSWEEIIRMNKPVRTTTPPATTPLIELNKDVETETPATNFVQDDQNQGMQRIPFGQSPNFETTTTQRMAVRPQVPSNNNNNMGNQEMMFADKFVPQQPRPNQPIPMGNSRFIDSQNRQPSESTQFSSVFRNQQSNPNVESFRKAQSDLSFSNGQTIDNGNFVSNSNFETTTVGNLMSFQNQNGNPLMMSIRPMIRNQIVRPSQNQFEGTQNSDRARLFVPSSRDQI